MMLAPILLFVYNRPAHAKRAIEALLHNTLAPKASCLFTRMRPVAPKIANR